MINVCTLGGVPTGTLRRRQITIGTKIPPDRDFLARRFGLTNGPVDRFLKVPWGGQLCDLL
jgi:hypothetical protein